MICKSSICPFVTRLVNQFVANQAIVLFLVGVNSAVGPCQSPAGLWLVMGKVSRNPGNALRVIWNLVKQ